MDDWDTLLGGNPRIAPDIKFRIIEEVLVDGSQETKTEVFAAHKFILSFISDVFKALFYGTMREETEEILIRDTTIEAFKEFLKMIYILADKRRHTQVTDVKLLFEILSLTKRYIIPDLEAFVEEQLSLVRLTEINVIPTVILANEYKTLDGFQLISEHVLKACTRFLSESFSSINLFKFLGEVQAEYSENTLGLIIKLLAGSTCKNCKKSPCFDGENVTQANAVHGARVVAADADGNGGMYNLSSGSDGYARIIISPGGVVILLIDLGGLQLPLHHVQSVKFACT